MDLFAASWRRPMRRFDSELESSRRIAISRHCTRGGLDPINGYACPDRAGAFTIVEMMVAVAVVGILGALGAASYGGVIGRTRVVSDSNDLLNAIELTRAEAAKRGRRVTMLPVRGDWAAGWTIFVDSDGNRQVDAGEPVIALHAPLHRSTRIVTSTVPGYIAFAASGMPQQYSGAFLAGTVSLCDAGILRSIVLAKTGRPRVVAGTC